jgi:hypothetical protein
MTIGSISPLPLTTKYEAGLKEQMITGTLNFVQGKISMPEIFVANHALPRNHPTSSKLDSRSSPSGYRFGENETKPNMAR